MMRLLVCSVLLLCIAAAVRAQVIIRSDIHSLTASGGVIADRYRWAADGIIARAMMDSVAYRHLSRMCDLFGPRFSGTENLERAIDWVIAQMKSDGFDSVRGEPVMVPRWVRGRESCELIAPRQQNMAVLGLGGSIGTPPNGVSAEVMVVRGFDELKRRAAEAKGKIVLFNVIYTDYGETVQYRLNGAVNASRAGAVASLIRSPRTRSTRRTPA